ncbi:MAG: acyl-CoA dehydrogenase family protein, partial [Myxococcota bacterium]
MDLTYTEAEEAFRHEARRWLEAHVPRTPLGSGDTREGFARHVAWEKTLFEGRWAVVSWPKAYGGREASLIEWLIFEEEYYRAGAPQRVTQNGIFLLAPSIFEFGSQEQKDTILPAMAAAEVLWAQGWSEPGAGSDLANIRSVAVRDEDASGWRLTGQKTWCTRGSFCDAVYGLFRTDPESVRHRGLTYFLVPLDTPGVQVRGFDRLDGDEGFAEVFFEDAFVPDSAVLGEVGQGWRVAMSTASSERGLNLRSPGRFLATASRLVELYRTSLMSHDPTLRRRVLRAWMDAQAYQLYTTRTATRLMRRESIGSESSLTKVFWSEMDLAMHETALELLGPLAELDEGSPSAPDDGAWLKGFQFALAGPIYAGT